MKLANTEPISTFTNLPFDHRQKKKLLLTEVPREEVKVDLGPMYPSPLKLLTMSLDRKYTMCKKEPPAVTYAVPRIPKHPHVSTIPKHPFVSLTKMDEPEEQCEEYVVIKNDLYEVQFRRNSASTNPRAYSYGCLPSSDSSDSVYDVPRRFLSKSDSEIQNVCRNDLARDMEPIYDVPRRCYFERPRSSLYDDALSLKRRSLSLDERYQKQPQYATVKPLRHRQNNALHNSYQHIASSIPPSTLVF